MSRRTRRVALSAPGAGRPRAGLPARAQGLPGFRRCGAPCCCAPATAGRRLAGACAAQRCSLMLELPSRPLRSPALARRLQSALNRGRRPPARQATEVMKLQNSWPNLCRASWSGCQSSKKGITRRALCRWGRPASQPGCGLCRRCSGSAWRACQLRTTAARTCRWLGSQRSFTQRTRGAVRCAVGLPPHGQPDAVNGRLQGAGRPAAGHRKRWGAPAAPPQRLLAAARAAVTSCSALRRVAPPCPAPRLPPPGPRLTLPAPPGVRRGHRTLGGGR